MCNGCTPEGEKPVFRKTAQQIEHERRYREEQESERRQQLNDIEEKKWIDENVKDIKINCKEDVERTCEKVKKEIEEALKMRNAYADEKLLARAEEEGWEGARYDQAVADQVFPPKPVKGGVKGESKASWLSPQGTDPATCRRAENWNLNDYQTNGVPKIIYYADRVHENVHGKSCRDDQINYRSNTDKPRYRSQDEIKAYDAKIEFLKKWVAKNCEC